MSPALVFFAIFIFLIYIFMMPYRKENFTNSQEVATKVDNVFKKNFDLDYIDAREGGNISELSKILTNRIAPIMDSSKGRKQKRSAIVQDVPKRLTNRIPDDKSNNKEYKIPMPKFDDLQKGLLKPLMKSFKELNEMKNMSENKPPEIQNKPKEVKKELFNDNKKKIQVRKITNQNYCKFVTSFGKNDNKCPADYNVFTGATFSGDGSTISCNGSKIDVKSATGFAIINKGSIVDVKITEKGSRYENPPKIYFRGVGKGAIARSIIKDGEVKDIIIINGGQGYHSTPTVIIEKPNPMVHCNLCCKNEL